MRWLLRRYATAHHQYREISLAEPGWLALLRRGGEIRNGRKGLHDLLAGNRLVGRAGAKLHDQFGGASQMRVLVLRARIAGFRLIANGIAHFHHQGGPAFLYEARRSDIRRRAAEPVPFALRALILAGRLQRRHVNDIIGMLAVELVSRVCFLAAGHHTQFGSLDAIHHRHEIGVGRQDDDFLKILELERHLDGVHGEHDIGRTLAG